MTRQRSSDDIILNSLDYYRKVQPEADTKPGTVIRDIFIDAPAVQLSKLYSELSRASAAQSLRNALGSDLDDLAKNYGETREKSTKATGVCLMTFSELQADIAINSGDIVTAKNGESFIVVNSTTASPVFANTFRATASKFRAGLDFAGITDEYAIEVFLESVNAGNSGNISKYSLSSTVIPGISNVTNVSTFSGGNEVENDASFKRRLFSIFSGSNTGTALGYSDSIKADPAVLDVIIVEPGDDLMTRDGTQVTVSEDGTRTIISEGTGGKVDAWIYGTRLVEVIDSFIYRDKSNQDDPTNSVNDFVLGQIEGDEKKTVTTRRKDNLESGALPNQPVNDIIQISGSSSGSNFIPKSIDLLGRVSGNYELIRDEGSFGGSPWGFDRLHWISNQISGFSEDITKGRFNGQDPVTFADILKVSGVNQQISIINENSKVSPKDRSSIQLAHKPITNVTRVFNLTTGEQYVISSQFPDGGPINTTGRITIRGNTLPAVSDTLQVDYTWLFDYDSNTDFDNRITNTNPRSVVDSIDWGFSNAVRRELNNIVADGDFFKVLVTHPISSVATINSFVSETKSVVITSGRLSIIVDIAVENVVGIKRISDSAELYDSKADDGSFSGFTIFLPTDTTAVVGDSVEVVYNAFDVFTVDDVSGSFDGTTITLPATASVTAGQSVECSYISNVRTLLPTTLLPSLPALKSGNGFQTGASSQIGTQPTTHKFDVSDNIIQNLRIAPSRLRLSISGSISPGVITVTGSSIILAKQNILTVSKSGLRHDLASLIKKELSINSDGAIPSNIKVGRIISVEKVSVSGVEVLNTSFTYDMSGYQLKDNSYFKSESILNSALSSTEFQLPLTVSNSSVSLSVGDKLRVFYYLIKESDSENVSFSQSGSLFTDKRFLTVDSIAISSGFISASSQQASLTVLNQNQPDAGTRYTGTYDYLSPKTNERITIRYNKNDVITSATKRIERVRPITADVLAKASSLIFVDAGLAIVLVKGYEKSEKTIIQNVKNAITNALNSAGQNAIVDRSDLNNICYTIDGVDRVRFTRFNKSGVAGMVLSVFSDKTKYIRAGNVDVIVETR